MGAEPCVCLACQAKGPGFYFTKANSHGSYPVYQCRSCGTAFAWPRPTPSEMERYYRDQDYHALSTDEALQQDEQYYPNSRSDALRMISRCRKLGRGPKFLDAGAGFGEFSKAAAEHGFDVMACEPNPNAGKIFRARNGFDPENHMFDDAYAARYRDFFDVVLLSHVLEHTPDPLAVARNVHRVLRQEGIAAIAVPHFGSALSKIQGRKDMFISPPEHLNYFSRPGLVAIFEKHGFELIGLHTSSKINKSIFARKIPIRVFDEILWRAGYVSLAMWNPLRLGMVLNAFFRKI